ncbi:RNA-directed DNA polymerase, eukaryota, partial [Tanacetum coccineum]
SLASTSTDDVVDDRIKRYVEDALVDIRRGMEAMLTQIANGGGNWQQTQYIRMTKVEFQKFSGDDVRGWIFRQFLKVHGENVTWPVYRDVIIQRFGTVFDDPMAELKNVKYTREDFVDVDENLDEMETEEEFHILIESGSTHNFLDTKMAKRLGCAIRPLCPLTVNVAGEKQLLSVSEFLEEQRNDKVLEPELTQVAENFSDVFEVPHELPPKRNHDHRIPLIPGTPHVNIRPYRHHPIKKDAIEAMVKELLEQLNKSTIKDKFPIPIIDELIDELQGAVVFSKLDLRSGYHQIGMFEDDIAKTAFRTHEGHHEFLVMPFGLTNAPSTFQALMNDVFKGYLRKFVLVFFDDILIYSKIISKHVEHLATILTNTRQTKLFAKKTKSTDPSKIAAMQNWPTPMHIKQLRGFFGLIGYYRKFIKSPVLALLDFTKSFVVETNASGVGIGAVLQQNGHPIAYLSKALAPKHQTLLTYEKEFLAVMMALEKSLASTSTDDVVDDRIKRYVEDALVDIRRGMEAMLTQIANGGGNRQQTQYIRMTKVEFLKFSGDDVRGWIFRQFLKVHGENVTWPVYRDVIIQRFGTVFDDPMAELKNVKYTSNAKEYQDKFDDLLSMVEVSVEHSMSLYLGVLPTKLEMRVRMFRPQTLVDAYRFTNLQEATLNALKKNNKMQFGNSGSKFGSNGNTTSTTTKPLLALPNTTRSWSTKPNTNPPRKQLSQKEYEEKRSKNLCFYRDKKYVPGHKCKGQLFTLVVLADQEEQEEDFVDVDENLDEMETEEVQPQISLNALSGVSSYQTLRVVGLFMNGQEFHILINLGSTHNFLDTKMAKRLGCAIRPSCPLTVNVAREKQLLSVSEWCDMVLGIQWLSTLGDIKSNFKDLRMEFVYNNKKMVLRGTHKTRVQWAEGKGQLHKMGGTPQAEMFMLCMYPNTGLNMLVLEEQINDKVLEPELTQVAENFSDVFEVPHELPPKRNHDHRIPLIPGTPLVNIRPYRHPPIKKDAIEAIVKELLESGVIKPSQIPFSSSIVMVKKKDNTWRICADYRQLNKSTIKDKFPIPIIDELIDELHGVVVFSKLDLRSGYHQIGMFKDNIAKIAFRTHKGHYEFLVMPFGLTNAPFTFQALMNDVFKGYLRKFVLVFFDDILIYSKSISKHVEHLATILTNTRQTKLFAKKTKYVFGTSQVEYLGHVISAQCVATDPSKIAAMQN